MNENILVPGIPIVGSLPQAVPTETPDSVQTDAQGFQGILQNVVTENGQESKTAGKVQILESIHPSASRKTMPTTDLMEIPITMSMNEKKSEREGEIGLLAMTVVMTTPPVIFQPVATAIDGRIEEDAVGLNTAQESALPSIASGITGLAANTASIDLPENQALPIGAEDGSIKGNQTMRMDPATTSRPEMTVADNGTKQTIQTLTKTENAPVVQSPLPVETTALPEMETAPVKNSGFTAVAPNPTENIAKADVGIGQGEKSPVTYKADSSVILSKETVKVSASVPVVSPKANDGPLDKDNQIQATVVALNEVVKANAAQTAEVLTKQPGTKEVWNDLRPVTVNQDTQPIGEVLAKPIDQTPSATETVRESFVAIALTALDETGSQKAQGDNGTVNLGNATQSLTDAEESPYKDSVFQPQQGDSKVENSFSTRGQERPIINTATASEKLPATTVVPRETGFATNFENAPVMERSFDEPVTNDQGSSKLTTESQGQVVAKKTNISLGRVSQERLESKPIDPAMLTARQQGHVHSVQGQTMESNKAVVGPVFEKNEQFVSLEGAQSDKEMGSIKVKDTKTVLGVKTEEPAQDLYVKEMAQPLTTGNLTTTPSENRLSAPASKTVTYEPREVVNQIVHGTHVMVRDGAAQMQIRLDPPELGRVELKIIAEHDGIKAHFVAESQTVKALIETQLPHLRNALQQAGVQADALSVSVGGHGGQNANNGNAFNGRENHQFFGQNQRYSDSSDEDLRFAESEVAASPWMGRINLKA